jgi:hypothetical protein
MIDTATSRRIGYYDRHEIKSYWIFREAQQLHVLDITIDTATSRLIGYYDRHGNITAYWIL